jgi:hypothetical protein
MPVLPYASPNAVQTVLDFLAEQQPKAANAKPAEFYDMSYLKRIDESGFIKTLEKER